MKKSIDIMRHFGQVHIAPDAAAIGYGLILLVLICGIAGLEIEEDRKTTEELLIIKNDKLALAFDDHVRLVMI